MNDWFCVVRFELEFPVSFCPVNNDRRVNDGDIFRQFSTNDKYFFFKLGGHNVNLLLALI